MTTTKNARTDEIAEEARELLAGASAALASAHSLLPKVAQAIEEKLPADEIVAEAKQVQVSVKQARQSVDRLALYLSIRPAREEALRRRLAYRRATTDAEREAAGLAYAEARVRAFRAEAESVFAMHWPIPYAGQEGRAAADFRAVQRAAKKVERELQALPRRHGGPTVESARSAAEFNARLGRLIRVAIAIGDDARELAAGYERDRASRIRRQRDDYLERSSERLNTLTATCRPLRRAQGPRTRRLVLRRRTTRGSPARPEPDPASRRTAEHLHAVVLRRRGIAA